VKRHENSLTISISLPPSPPFLRSQQLHFRLRKSLFNHHRSDYLFFPGLVAVCSVASDTVSQSLSARSPCASLFSLRSSRLPSPSAFRPPPFQPPSFSLPALLTPLPAAIHPLFLTLLSSSRQRLVKEEDACCCSPKSAMLITNFYLTAPETDYPSALDPKEDARG